MADTSPAPASAPEPVKQAMDSVMLRDLLSYDASTGQFRWRMTRGGSASAGDIAGYPRKGGWQIEIGGKAFRAHRLAWLYLHGEWPDGDIDHIDGNPHNNRIVNLRIATRTQNNANARRHADNQSGYKGVSRSRTPSKPWQARINRAGRTYRLGSYATPQEAHAAYVAAASRLFGEFARPG